MREKTCNAEILRENTYEVRLSCISGMTELAFLAGPATQCVTVTLFSQDTLCCRCGNDDNGRAKFLWHYIDDSAAIAVRIFIWWTFFFLCNNFWKRYTTALLKLMFIPFKSRNRDLYRRVHDLYSYRSKSTTLFLNLKLAKPKI